MVTPLRLLGGATVLALIGACGARSLTPPFDGGAAAETEGGAGTGGGAHDAAADLAGEAGSAGSFDGGAEDGDGDDGSGPSKGWTTAVDGGHCISDKYCGEGAAQCGSYYHWCCKMTVGPDGCTCGKGPGCHWSKVCCIPDEYSEWTCMDSLSECWKG